MHWANLPPLNSLKAFAALAESGSYVKAGDSLSVTHAAISQQVKSLEDRLEIPLVAQDGRGVKLTTEGLKLAQELQVGFAAFHRGIDQLEKDSVIHPVQLTTSPAFAMEWLMPRIQDFQSRFPEIPLMFNPTVKVLDLKPGGVEVAVRYKDARKLDIDVETVLLSDMVIMAAASYVGEQIFSTPEDLANFRWLEELGTNEVREWYSYRKTHLKKMPKITQMPGNLIMQALRKGSGVSYTSRAFFKEDIKSGTMRVLFSDSAVGIYHVETCAGPRRKSVQVFVDWLLGQAERCVVDKNGGPGRT